MVNIAKKYSYEKVWGLYQDLLNEAHEWRSEYEDLSDYLIPGRGVYTTFTKPRKRKLSSPKVVNSAAEDALYVLTANMHGGLTSPTMPWFDITWSNARVKQVEELQAWMQDSVKRLHAAMQASNFYSIVNSFYVELVGFGTGSVYVGEDTNKAAVPFRFELLTAGEYVFSNGVDGVTNTYCRVAFMSPAQLVERFPKTASKEIRDVVKDNEAGANKVSETILETVVEDAYNKEKPYTQIYYVVSSSGQRAGTQDNRSQKPLEVNGFYEFPYKTATWNTIGSDTLGVGPGSRALPHIKRLQEMEKTLLMANHKQLDPPVNAPSRMRGKLNTLPGGFNYYVNPAEVVTELYNVNFDPQGTIMSIERTEQALQKIFFNDIFFASSRDPNASPYKAAEVAAREQEKMLRLGPVIERLQHQFLAPLIQRCFNIMQRKELLAELKPELAEIAGDYEISVISPMATAQKMVAMQGIQTYIGTIGQLAQFKQDVMDNIDVDAAAREIGDITGVSLGIMRPQSVVDADRKQRAEAAAKEKNRADAMQAGGVEGQMNLQQAQAQKTQAEAGAVLADTQQTSIEAGIM